MEDTRIFEIEQQQSQLDNLRRQLQASMERERSYKNEIAELQQKISRRYNSRKILFVLLCCVYFTNSSDFVHRYMAVKAQEKKASRREMQLERKVKELEEELHEAKEMLDRHFMVQQAKRAKVTRLLFISSLKSILKIINVLFP